MIRPALREALLRIRVPYWMSSTGYMIDGLPSSIAAWLFRETPTETLRRRLWELSRSW